MAEPGECNTYSTHSRPDPDALPPSPHFTADDVDTVAQRGSLVHPTLRSGRRLVQESKALSPSPGLFQRHHVTLCPSGGQHSRARTVHFSHWNLTERWHTLTIY